jgi:hypothetical protein
LEERDEKCEKNGMRGKEKFGRKKKKKNARAIWAYYAMVDLIQI